MAREHLIAAKPYYECHITMVGDKDKIKKAVEAIGWSFSAIDKDIILGEGIKCYATNHFNARMSQDEVIIRVSCAATVLRECCEFEVLREKVECVIYDKRPAPIHTASRTSEESSKAVREVSI